MSARDCIIRACWPNMRIFPSPNRSDSRLPPTRADSYFLGIGAMGSGHLNHFAVLMSLSLGSLRRAKSWSNVAHGSRQYVRPFKRPLQAKRYRFAGWGIKKHRCLWWFSYGVQKDGIYSLWMRQNHNHHSNLGKALHRHVVYYCCVLKHIENIMSILKSQVQFLISKWKREVTRLIDRKLWVHVQYVQYYTSR
jgi:hypothetical protein